MTKKEKPTTTDRASLMRRARLFVKDVPHSALGIRGVSDQIEEKKTAVEALC